MSEIRVVSAKLLKGAEKLEVFFNKTAPVAGSDGFKGDNRPHPDLVNKFQALSVHLAVLSDYVKPKDVKKAALDKFVVTSYHYTIKEESEKVKIIGYKLTEHGASFINPPSISLDENDNDYQLVADLLEKLADIDAEVTLYLGGKKAPDPQQSLFAADDDPGARITKLQIVPPADEDDSEQGEDEENDDHHDDDFAEDEALGDDGDDMRQPAGSSKRRSKGIPQADKEAMNRVNEWTPGQYAKEIGKGEVIDAEHEQVETKKRGRKVKNK
jgi:hypothetical protein